MNSDPRPSSFGAIQVAKYRAGMLARWRMGKEHIYFVTSSHTSHRMQTQKKTAVDKCALCLDPLTATNDSEEHIIPNSIGGWMTIAGFICRECNNRKGRTWDAALSKQFAWMSSMAGISRDRGSVPPVVVSTVGGKDYKLHNDGTMTPARFQYSQVSDGDKVKISFVARDMGEARKKVAELKQRYPNLDDQAVLSSAKMSTSYLAEPLKVDLASGGPEVGRSIVTTALAYAFKLGISPHECEVVLPFLRQPELLATSYGWSSLIDVVKARKPGHIFHCVSIWGDPKTSRLLAYVEYFSFARWHIELSRQYDGPAIASTYAIAPDDSREVEINVDWNLELALVARILDGDGYDSERTAEAVGLVMDTLMKRSWDRSFNLAYQAACKEVMLEMGLSENDSISGALYPNFAQKIVEAMAPFIMHQRNRMQPA